MEIPYNRNKAVDYAHKWAFQRNPRYYNFDGIGGDCTNFASQAIFAGCGVMNYTPTMGWYYNNVNDRTPSWSGVKYLYNFLINNDGRGPYAEEVHMKDVQPGDIAQLSFDGVNFAHSPVIVSVGEEPNPKNILVCAHTFNVDNRKLSGYIFSRVRFIHIIGARI